MRKRAFLINSLMLTSAVLLSRVIGISFRVYMSNKIGAEGIGLYQLICISVRLHHPCYGLQCIIQEMRIDR